MTSKSLKQKARSYPEEFDALPIDGQFRKRDVEVFNEHKFLFDYLTQNSACALEKVGYDDDAGVNIYQFKSDVQDFLREFQS